VLVDGFSFVFRTLAIDGLELGRYVSGGFSDLEGVSYLLELGQSAIEDQGLRFQPQADLRIIDRERTPA
jgi:hypothetical protein